ncbi:MAG: flagellin [Kordiimonadaceae bacterium]|nr:flagellin [Kordiimonadaceae bacterium]
MGFSVNTNAGALAALRTLGATTALLRIAQNQITTGLKVSSAKDNGATFAIAQRLRGDVAGLNAVKGSLDRASSTVDVALAASEAVSDLLIELKEKAVAASDAGLDTASRTAINQDFLALRDQITSIVNNASFNGTNAVNGTGTISAITNANGSNSISIASQNLSLSGGTVLITTTQSISTATLAAAAVTDIENSIANLNISLSALGSGANRLDLQRNFVNKLSDSIEVGIGNLVDADLARVSANLQALQVRQQLGIQALAIANQAPTSILSLFR